MDSVPRDRLLVVRTSHLSDAVHRIAEFMDIDPGLLSRPERRNQSPRRHGLLDQVDEDHVEGLIHRHCAATISRLEERSGGASFDRDG